MFIGSIRGGSSSPLYRCAPSLLVLFGVPAIPLALGAQEPSTPRTDVVSEADGRIWGRVETVSGQAYEGFVRWGTGGGSWVDLLASSKDLTAGEYLAWNDRTGSPEPVPERVVEYGGYRISFPDHLSDFPSSAESGIRFGHIRRIRVRGEAGATLELKSGQVLELSGGGADLGRGRWEILVEEPGGRGVTVVSSTVLAVEFGAAPTGVASPSGRRLHGTVKDRWGNEYTGFIAWGADKILDTDLLEGREGPTRRQIPFGRIAAVEKTEVGARVALTDGPSIEMAGPGDVGTGSRRILVSDPGLGWMEVRWRDLESVRFHPPSRTPAYEDFDGGRPLMGTVVTREGHELTGRIRWDADEEDSWELLDGSREGVSFDVELGHVATIERLLEQAVTVSVGAGVAVDRERRDGVRATLRDGRVLELTGSNDVSRNNKGIWVRPDPESEWIAVRWEDFKLLRLHR